ncbi:hypothetical protein AGMMS49579_24480 [Spirochaetia bacterium]|nr:hypothetical protein AGMMS49579_24480 [Spirochaetia bacterium]
MKKLSVSKALIGLFVVLAVGIGFAACEIGTYEWETSSNTYSIELASGGKATYTATPRTGSNNVTKYEGDYTVSGSIITITWTSGSYNGTATPNWKNITAIYKLEGKSLIQQNTGGTKKSVDNEAIELELANDLSAEELEALGL